MTSLEDLRVRLIDVVLVVTIPAILALVHIGFPTSFRQQFVFDHSNPSLLTMWTSAYVHRSMPHLTNNLVGYAAAILPIYCIFAYESRERWFRHLVVILLLMMPFLISAADYGFFQWALGAEEAATRGFSGIVGALYGLLFAALLGLVQRESEDWQTSFWIGLAVILLVMGNILFYSDSLTVPAAGAITVGIALTFWALIPLELVKESETRQQFADDYFIPTILALYGAAVLVILLPALFPVEWIHENSVTNIFGHFIGFLLGFLISAVAPRVF